MDQQEKPEPTPRERILTVCEELKITMDHEFVPWSKSRNKGEKTRSLNWKVRLYKDAKNTLLPFLEADYGAGIAHRPSHKQGDRSQDHADAIKTETEHGYRASKSNPRAPLVGTSYRIVPDFANVMYSLALDGEAVNFPSFKEWASDFGYDPDSRSAEATYKACLDTGLKLRAALGDDGLRKLREAARDF